MSVFLNLLGWDHAQVGAKAVDFAEEFSALGVTIQLNSLHSGSFVLANKPSRIEKIVKMLDDVSRSGTLSRAQASEIQGHLNFASGFFLSKALKFLLGRFDAAARFASRDKAVSIKHLRVDKEHTIGHPSKMLQVVRNESTSCSFYRRSVGRRCGFSRFGVL